MHKLTPLLAIFLVSACGGTVTTPPSPTLTPVTPAPVVKGLGSGLAGTVLSNDSTGATVTSITFDSGSGATALAGVIKLAPDGSTYGQVQNTAASGNGFDVIAFSDDGKSTFGANNIVSATTIATSDNATGQFSQYATYSRDSNSILPTSGSGTYTGDYRGTIGATGRSYHGHTNGAPVAITGNVTLNTNFVAQTISGNITGRASLLANSTSDRNFSNVALSSTAIDSNGQFTSTASSSTGSGTYEGLIGGTNGTGIAGAIDLTHGNFTEVGVFSAIKQ